MTAWSALQKDGATRAEVRKFAGKSEAHRRGNRGILSSS